MNRGSALTISRSMATATSDGGAVKTAGGSWRAVAVPAVAHMLAHSEAAGAGGWRRDDHLRGAAAGCAGSG